MKDAEYMTFKEVCNKFGFDEDVQRWFEHQENPDDPILILDIQNLGADHTREQLVTALVVYFFSLI